MFRRRANAGLSAAIGALLCGSALADNYPAKPLKLIIPFPPGGTTDIIGRGAA